MSEIKIKLQENVTVDGEIVTSDGEPVVVTVEDVIDYIDQSQEDISEEIKGDVKEWFENNYDDLSEEIADYPEFINDVYAGLTNIVDPETLELIINLVMQLCG